MTEFTPYMPGAEPFFQAAGPVGCLCLHGFSATPYELRWLGQHLAQHNITVYIPRLSGHGTQPTDLASMRWPAWYADAVDGFLMLRAQCEQVFVLGHSMGGLLALLLAADDRFDPAGLVVLASPVRIDNPLIRLVQIIRYIRPLLDMTDRTDFPERVRAQQALRGEPVRGRIRYNQWATAALAQLNQLMSLTRARLPRVTAPLLLLYSEKDLISPLHHRDEIIAGVSSPIIEYTTLKRSDHILPQDDEQEIVFEQTVDFIARHSRFAVT